MDVALDGAAAAVDLAKVIAEFAVDSSDASLALPASLSADERQVAKRLVGQYSQIECASFGFGPERRLHLLRRRSSKGGSSTSGGGIGTRPGSASTRCESRSSEDEKQ